MVTRALITGTELIVHDGFDAAAVEGEGRSHGAVLVSLVSTAFLRIDPSVFHTIVLGGGRPPKGVLADNVVTTYGMTETGSGVVYDGVPLDDVEVRIVDGEVHLRGPMLLREYRQGGIPRWPMDGCPPVTPDLLTARGA